MDCSTPPLRWSTPRHLLISLELIPPLTLTRDTTLNAGDSASVPPRFALRWDGSMLLSEILRWTAVGTALVFFTAGCISQSDETPAPAVTDTTAASSTTRGPGSLAWMSSVMPTDAELTDALGYIVTTDGPPNMLPGRKFWSTFIGSGQVAERDCIGVVSPLEQEAYSSAPITAVSFATQAAATYSAAVFDSGRWRQSGV